ncbi:hypothetical protein U1Q18_008237 [Sarracenia purpurea var. burkii]
MGSCYFSLAQWQELELQASIFRHMLAGSAVPPELLHLVKKSLISPSSLPPPPPYYLHHHPLQHHSHYHPALLQSGYWGRAAMDPEPGRCRRTDGKKWRCSRDVVAGQKYCERHVHRGRNRSRKTVEIHTASSAGGDGSVGGSHGGGMQKDNVHIAAQTLASGTHFDFPEPPPSIDLLQLNQRIGIDNEITGGELDDTVRKEEAPDLMDAVEVDGSKVLIWELEVAVVWELGVTGMGML